MKTALRTLCIFVASISSGIVPVYAADSDAKFPNRPVRVIVPQAAGGGTDLLSRQFAAKLSESLGQQFVVDNRTGAGSTIGTNIATKATPDGHTLIVSSISMAFNATLFRNLPYDTIKDLGPVGLIATSPNLLVVHPANGAKSVADLIRLAKANPGKLNYGSGGTGGSDHVCMEYFLRTAGIKVVNVSYKGSAPALIELAAGALDVAFPPIASAMPLVKPGRLRALGVSTPKRTPLLPDVPTIAEAGVPRFDYSTWYGMWGPAGMPRPVVAKLNEEIRKAQLLPDVRERLAFLGAEPASMSVEAFSSFFKAEVARWAPIIKDFSPPTE